MNQWLLVFGFGALLLGIGLWRNRQFDSTKVAGNMLLLWVGTLCLLTALTALIGAYLVQLWFPDYAK